MEYSLNHNSWFGGKPVKITLPQKQTLYVGRSLQLTPQTTPEGASATFTWKSGNPAVATVEDGLVTGEFDAPADHKPSQVDVVSLMM